MKIQRKTLNVNLSPSSLDWRNDKLVDWLNGGNTYDLQGNLSHSSRGYAYKFDSAIQSKNGEYSILYERTGTKGIVLKNGELIREINRSYYQAHAYEYPICIVELRNEKFGIAHCPNEYNLIELEHIETGKSILRPKVRTPDDCFHSRLRTNPSNTKLINSGWVWHPYGIFQLYDIDEAIEDSSILDNSFNQLPINSEICSAEFLDDDLIFISSTLEEHEDISDEEKDLLNPGEIGIYSISNNSFLKKIRLTEQSGNLIPLSVDFTIDLYNHPKLIDMNNGEIVTRFEDISTGNQDSSIIWNSKFPPIAFDHLNKRIAIGGNEKIELLTYE